MTLIGPRPPVPSEEKEYKDLQKSPRVQSDKKFAFYGLKTLWRVDKEARELIHKKYKK